MIRLLIAVVLLWALLTSGVGVGEVVGVAGNWAFDHVQVTVR